MISILIIYSIIDIIAQNKQYQYLDAESGLVHGYNDHILKRANGTVWISSDNGIYEFDGFELKLYNELSDSTFKGEIVYSDFFELSNSNVLFSTDKGLYSFNDYDGHFEAIIEDYPNAKNEYYLISIEADTTAWARIGDSISYIDIRSGEYISLVPTQSVRYDHKYYKDQVIIAGCPWIQKGGIEFITLDKDNFINSTYLEPSIIEAGYKITPEFSDVIIINDSLLYGSSEYGLFRINPHDSTATERFVIPNITSSSFLYITTENESKIVLSTRDKGIWRFNLNTEQFDQVLNDKNGLRSNDTRAVYFDHSGFYWISSFNNGALSYGPMHTPEFTNIDIAQNNDNPKPINFIFENDNSINAFSSEGIYSISLDGTYTFESYQDVNTQRVLLSKPYHISQSYNGERIWISSEGKIFNINSLNQLSEQYNLGQDRVMSFHQFDPNLALLFTSEDLSILNLQNGEKSSINLKGLSNGPLEITRILNSEGRYFLVYNDRTLYEILLDEHTIDVERPMKCQSSIFSLTLKSQNEIILSTSNGIESVRLVDGIYSSQLHRPHHIDVGAYYKVFDTGENYLIASSKGLLTVDTLFENWRVYSTSDGMISDEFINDLGCTSTTGEYILPAKRGIVIVESNLSEHTFNKPTIALSNLTINEDLYQKTITTSDGLIHLNYNENSISLKPRCISYSNQKKNQLFYRLDESQNWKRISNRDNLYLRLNSGRYQLQFVGIDAHGVYSDIESLKLCIAYPFWRTLPFILISVLSAGSIIIFISRSYYRRSIRKKEEKFQQEKLLAQKLEHERNRIAAEMHDELGGGLTSIHLLSQKMSRSNVNSTLDSSIQKVEQYSADLVENMRSIVWSMDSSNSTLSDTVSYIRHYIDDTLENAEISTTFNINLHNPESEMSTTIRRNLYLIIKEIITNILKHSKATEVRFRCIEKDFLFIKVSDNGIGMLTDLNNTKGHGIKNIQKRVKDIDGKLHINNEKGLSYLITLNINHAINSKN